MEARAGRLLTAAALDGSVAELTRLLDEGLPVDAFDAGYDWTALHVCCQQKSVEGVRLLLSRGADCALRELELGLYPLHFAMAATAGGVEGTQASSLAILKLLVAAAESAHEDLEEWVNRRTMIGETPLHYAAAAGYAECARLLLSCGASVCLRSNHARGASAVLRRARGPMTPLHYAAGDVDSPETISALLAAGANPNDKSGEGRTAVLIACAANKLGNLGVLLERGGSATEPDANGLAPLHFACARGFLEAATSLLDHGVPIALRDRDGLTPLHVACQYGQATVTRELLRRGADVNARGSKCLSTPLSLTLQHKGEALGCVEALLQAGADPNIPRTEGRVPLLDACAGEHVAAARLLLEGGADPEYVSDLNVTPLHFAAALSPVLVGLILKHGAGRVDVHRVSTTGQTPLATARSMNQHAVVRLLLEAAEAAAPEEKEAAPEEKEAAEEEAEARLAPRARTQVVYVDL